MDTKKLNETFALAYQNHQKNNLNIAKNLYEKILNIDPNHFKTVFLLGSLLTQNKNFYASLDVFKNEPLKRNHKLWNNPNVIITPHVAATSDIESSVDYIYQRFLNFIEKDKFVSDVNISCT